MIFGNIEAFEPSSEKDEGPQKKKESKTKLYYKPFKKREGVRIDKGEDEEKQIELKKLEKELDKAGKNQELVKRFKEVSKRLQPRKLWAKVKVAGETHHIEFVSLQQQNKIVSPQALESELQENPNVLKTIIANFSLKKTEGRPEPLFLSFKTTLTNILEGGGGVEKTLATLLEHQFAGTELYYKRLEEESEQSQKEEPSEFQADKAQLIGKLQKQGAQITELEGEKAYTIIATFPQESKQLHISTVNKEEWNVLEVKNQKKTEFTNLRPQEIINSHIEQQ
ncbi:MAG: hypothetical protein R3B71_03725 [Candidatus Gracilibacteria bacterium]